MDRIEAMKVYMRVSELSSFVKAAESLGMSKAHISNIIQQLEADTGTRLLHRTTRRVQMTQDGMTYYERCKDLLADIEELDALFKKDAGRLSGRIRVDMSTGIAKNLIVPRIPEFLKAHPGIEIELSSTDRRVDLVREGFDCVIRVGNLTDSGLIARPLGKFTVVNCVSPLYIKKHGRPKNLEDLSEHFLVHYVQTLGAKPDGFEYFDGEKFQIKKMRGQITVNNAENYLSACLAGLGIIQAPKAGLKEYLKNKSLIEILPTLKSEPMPVSLVYPHRRHVAKRVQVFMDWVSEIMRDYIV
ncbi:transcriptional regulator [Bdellovibrio bacteriovorus]|uniref:Transcriptional regulator n=1 Tax=Bdellovibrio bacteriovorus TaxID=959 RepID=A0A161PRB2_BDEBC|nr:LysR family transcriptional regulator [Bdellovibrio bacteriovorus]KYG64294.1 transcriptional regulator [Bdellovibrio bacteriovorus]